ncbi:hypothetical protein L195_g046856, partial [Trifolium pratense]
SCKLSETRIGRPFNGLEELGELIASLFASLVVIDTLSFVKFGSVLKPVDASEVRALMLSKFWFCDCGFELQEARTDVREHTEQLSDARNIRTSTMGKTGPVESVRHNDEPVQEVPELQVGNSGQIVPVRARLESVQES